MDYQTVNGIMMRRRRETHEGARRTASEHEKRHVWGYRARTVADEIVQIRLQEEQLGLLGEGLALAAGELFPAGSDGHDVMRDAARAVRLEAECCMWHPAKVEFTMRELDLVHRSLSWLAKDAFAEMPRRGHVHDLITAIVLIKRPAPGMGVHEVEPFTPRLR